MASPAFQPSSARWPQSCAQHLLLLLLMLTCVQVLCFAMPGWLSGADSAWTPPDADQRTRALGPLEDITPMVRAALDPGAFTPIDTPRPQDWLGEHQEAGQSFKQFERERHPHPDGIRKTLYLQPLGDFPAESSPDLERLRQFLAAYFMTPACLLPMRPLRAGTFQERFNPTSGERQLCTTSILKAMMQDKPPDAFAVIDVTMVDLYPGPAWNFVFGQASVEQGVGVFSFARSTPATGRDLTVDEATLLLRRACLVLAHETLHLFGIRHCIYYDCTINGSNSLEESDRHPLHLCPIDLRKLQQATGCDLLKRYRRLRSCCSDWGLVEEATWLTKEIHRIETSTR